MKRDLANAKLLGVCSGMSKYLGVDATVVRLIFVLATLFGLGSPILIYIVLALLMPTE